MTGISRRTFGLAAGFGAIGAGGLGGGCSTRSGPTPTPEPASRGVGVVLSPTTLGKRAELFAVVGDDKAAARAADLWRFTAGAVDQPNPVEIQRAAESNPIEKVLANWAVGTDPGVHIGAVQAVLDAGAVPFLHFPQDDPITAIDFYRTNVLPELR